MRLKGLRCLASGGDTKLLAPPIGVKSEIGYSLYTKACFKTVRLIAAEPPQISDSSQNDET